MGCDNGRRLLREKSDLGQEKGRKKIKNKEKRQSSMREERAVGGSNVGWQGKDKTRIVDPTT